MQSTLKNQNHLCDSFSKTEPKKETLPFHRESSVDILFKGLKRKVSQRSYSKLKNTYKTKNTNWKNSQALFNSTSINRQKSRLTITSNRTLDQEDTYKSLLQLKQKNHNLQVQNAQLLRKIRKEEKIEEIFRKKFQDKEIHQLDWVRLLEVKLLLDVQVLEEKLEAKEESYRQILQYLKHQKHRPNNQYINKKTSLYKYIVNNQEELEKIQLQKGSLLEKKKQAVALFNHKLNKARSNKRQNEERLNILSKKAKMIRERLKAIEEKNKIENNSLQAANLTSIMAAIIDKNSQYNSHHQHKKYEKSGESTSQILKNNMSSMSLKNKSNIDEVSKQIQKIQEEASLIKSQIQNFMDESIAKKILIYKDINFYQQHLNRKAIPPQIQKYKREQPIQIFSEESQVLI